MNIRRFSKAMDRANLWRKKERRHEKRAMRQYPPALFNIGGAGSQAVDDAGMSYDFGAADKDYAGLIAAVKVRNTANHRDAMCESDFCYRGQGRNVTPSLKCYWRSHQEHRYLRRSARRLARF
ncbi:hypothetical protein [Rhizobium sp. CNPSo 4039]|uniref:hypothetical protein n=1 Tax=Rhizobium sp. CNPSo 4039 TaxID=3021409 RepID=UPI00254C0EF2|nr:hypothetical protein [Rhizobium sp. CNPSo 4039]MDK4714078.1 hypothetical protein [Rhizobium sp. CNPSo 4039]